MIYLNTYSDNKNGDAAASVKKKGVQPISGEEMLHKMDNEAKSTVISQRDNENELAV